MQRSDRNAVTVYHLYVQEDDFDSRRHEKLPENVQYMKYYTFLLSQLFLISDMVDATAHWQDNSINAEAHLKESKEVIDREDVDHLMGRLCCHY